MNALKCPECGAEVLRSWPNPIRKTQLIGRCPKCGKMVTLGKVEGSEKTGAEKASAPLEKKAAGKGRKSAAPAAPATGAPSAGRKRGGLLGGLASFFELD